MFKFFIYALLLYVLYRLLTGGRRKKTVGNGRKTTGSGALAAHDQLVEDPVCHIYIPKRQAIVLQDGDTVVYFCSEQCRKMYCDARTTNRQENG
ncbi:MAG: TRASH domain protein [Proteobacteria bacterium]|nr:TRASH domain protein [Pseudomonadota bacterium]MBU1547468.1 TRASH domain protein [Pseudomonadota bacterium]MBU2619665.1 TRASH domain protein [Pseudomonadota bacterium]